MIKKITIHNFLLIKEATICLEDGFVAFTGESGSGKSLIFKAIRFCLGGRIDRSYIGKWDDEMSVSLTIQANKDEKSIKHTLSLKKRIGEINGEKTSLSKIKALSEDLIVDSYQGLVNKISDLSFQKAYIDSLVSSKVLSDFHHISKQYQDTHQKKQEMQNLLENEDKAWLEDQIETLKDIPDEKEYERLKQLQKRYQDFEKLQKDWASEKDALFSMKKTLYRWQRLDTINITEEVSEMENSLEAIEESVLSQLSMDGEMQYEAMHAQKTLSRLNDLSRKYKVMPSELFALYNSAFQKLEKLEEATREFDNLSKICDGLKHKQENMFDQLNQERERAALSLSNFITKNLILLGMEEAQFRVSFSQGLPTFEIKSNPGQAFKQIGDCLSGGELSRLSILLMLYQNKDSILILDEVDVGVSGKTGIKIRHLMQSLAKQRQVLCISHLAQVASGATQHYLVYKQTQDNEAISMLKQIKEDERALEISRLMCGKSTLSNQAKELLIN